MPNQNDRRDIDVFAKKIMIGYGIFLLTLATTGVITGIQMAGAVEANTELSKKNEVIISTESKTVIEIQIEQKYIKKDIQAVEKAVADNHTLILEVLREVKKK